MAVSIVSRWNRLRVRMPYFYIKDVANPFTYECCLDKLLLVVEWTLCYFRTFLPSVLRSLVRTLQEVGTDLEACGSVLSARAASHRPHWLYPIYVRRRRTRYQRLPHCSFVSHLRVFRLFLVTRIAQGKLCYGTWREGVQLGTAP